MVTRLHRAHVELLCLRLPLLLSRKVLVRLELIVHLLNSRMHCVHARNDLRDGLLDFSHSGVELETLVVKQVCIVSQALHDVLASNSHTFVELNSCLSLCDDELVQQGNLTLHHSHSLSMLPKHRLSGCKPNEDVSGRICLSSHWPTMTWTRS